MSLLWECSRKGFCSLRDQRPPIGSFKRAIGSHDSIKQILVSVSFRHSNGRIEDGIWRGNDVDQGNGEVVTGQETGHGDDQVAGGGLHQLAVHLGAAGAALGGGETDGGQDARLVQVDTVEGNVDQEPAGGGAEQGQQVTRVAEVGEELVVGLFDGNINYFHITLRFSDKGGNG